MKDEFFIGSVWGPTQGNNFSFQFNSDGSVEKIYKGKAFNFKWTISDDLITIEGGQREKFVIDKRRKELWTANDSGEKVAEFETKN